MILRVTEAIRLAGMMPEGPWYTKEALERGRDVHTATELLDENDLDWNSLERDVAARVNQYGRFRRECNVEIIGSEIEVEHKSRGYQGRVDRVVRINGRMGVLDLKPAEAPWHPIQLAAYRQALDIAGGFDDYPDLTARWNLYLTEDRYRLVERDNRHDWAIFLAALEVARFRRKHGLCR